MGLDDRLADHVGAEHDRGGEQRAGPDGRDGKGAAALDYDAYVENPARDAGDIVFAD